MATQNYINECKNRANANRLAKFNIDNLLLNQSNYISKIELKDSCYVNDTIIGSIYTQSVKVKLLDLPVDTKLVSKKIKKILNRLEFAYWLKAKKQFYKLKVLK